MAVTVSSTTSTQEELQQAADYGLKTAKAAPAEVETEEHPEADEAATGAESETAHTKEDESEPPEEPEEEEPKDEDEEPEEPEKQAMGKTRRKLLRRLSRLHSENLTLQERLEEAERKLQGEKPAAQTAPQAKPNPKDFKDYESYIEALADWKMQERDQQRAKAAQDEFLKSMFDDYNQQVETARETHEDFDEAVNTSAQVPIICINAIYEMENGAEVAYYLAKHADVRAELLQYNEPGYRGGVRKMLATLDRISEDLQSPKSSRSNGSAPVKPRPQTAAPRPITPVGSGASTRSVADPGKMPYKDYVKWYGQKYGRHP